MVFGVFFSGPHAVQSESELHRAYEGYSTLSASTQHYRNVKKWEQVDRNGVYRLIGHAQRNRAVENLLPDAEFANAADAARSSEADHLRKRKFADDAGKAHVNLVRHLVETTVKAQEVDARLLKVPKPTLQKQIHSVAQGMRDFMDSPTSMAGTRAIHQACNVPHNGKYTPQELDDACIAFILGLATMKQLQASHGPGHSALSKAVRKVYAVIATPGELYDDARARARKMTPEHLHSVLQGMRMRGELNKPRARPYLSAAETLLVMGCAGANASIGLGVTAACLRLQLATAIKTSGKRAQQAIAPPRGRSEGI